MYKIRTLNNISPVGLDKFPSSQYGISDSEENPDAIILRSYKMHDMPIPPALKAVGRAGAGVNNIPLDAMTAAGIPVFNAPGANANAVKELVLASLFLTARHINAAIDYTTALSGSDAELSKLVEQGKKKYAGFELKGKTIGIIGLGAIGRMVANSCANLGMHVIGFDPGLTVEGAWELSASVERASTIEQLLPKVDFLTVHVPLIEATRNLIHAENVDRMKHTAVLINLARGGIINDEAVCTALDAGKLAHYVTDFPNEVTQACAKTIGLPHLGASTKEAEDNCAVMVAEQIKEYFENGNIVNSVNFPNVSMQRGSAHRLVVCNQNVPNMVGQISTFMAQAGLNIQDMINQSRGEIAYTIVDLDQPISEQIIKQITQIKGVLNVRAV